MRGVDRLDASWKFCNFAGSIWSRPLSVVARHRRPSGGLRTTARVSSACSSSLVARAFRPERSRSRAPRLASARRPRRVPRRSSAAPLRALARVRRAPNALLRNFPKSAASRRVDGDGLVSPGENAAPARARARLQRAAPPVGPARWARRAVARCVVASRRGRLARARRSRKPPPPPPGVSPAPLGAPPARRASRARALVLHLAARAAGRRAEHRRARREGAPRGDLREVG